MPRAATIIAYHAIGDCPEAHDPHGLYMTQDLFARQMQYLAKERTVVPLTDAMSDAGHRGRPRVAITFDDGYRSVRQNALPVLEAYGFPATIFVPTACIGDQNRWDDPTPCGLEIMTRDELRDAERRGLSIESHGHDHLDLAHASEEAIRSDLTTSRELLTELLGHAPRFLAYPYGDASPIAEVVAESLGFDGAFTLAHKAAGRFAAARVPIARWDERWLFAMQTAGFFPRLRYSPLGAVLSRAFRIVRPRPKVRA